MTEANEPKESVRESTKNIVKETISDVIYRIAKASTKRAVKELKDTLKEKSIHKLERKLRDISEQRLEKQLNKSIKQVAKETAKDSAERVDFIRGIEQGFEKGFKKYLSSLPKVLPPFKAIVITCACLLVGGGAVFALLNLPQQYGSEPTPPPGEETALPGEEEEAPPPGEEEEAPPPGEEEEAPPPEEEKEAPPPEVKPDLIITEVWDEWSEKGAIVYYVIENQGDGEAAPSTTYLFIGGERIEDTVGPLAPGQRREEAFPPYFILFLIGFMADLEADGDNSISESNEQNNYFEYRRT